MTAVQAGPTSIRVAWTPSSDATGYRIDYESSGGYSGIVGVVGGSTVMGTLTGLRNGDTYTISIVATSDTGLPSASVVAMDVGLGKPIMRLSSLQICLFLVPWQSTISIGTSTVISIPITVSTASGSAVYSYEVMWETDDIGGCSGGSDMDSTTISSTRYDIMGLEEHIYQLHHHCDSIQFSW